MNSNKILNSMNLIFENGKKTALVGESGSGKTTISYLIERFYDVESGNILIDGVNIKDYNLKWLRENIGYIGQEPVLFSTTILENIKFGKENASFEEVVLAAKRANAYKFIMKLDNQFETNVGLSGAQLSGLIHFIKKIIYKNILNSIFIKNFFVALAVELSIFIKKCFIIKFILGINLIKII